MSKRISPQTGLLLAGVGAAGVLGSLWLPWYTIRLPQAFRDLFSKLGGGGASPSSSSSPSDQIASGLGAMMKGLAAAIPDEITGNGWQTMGSADWVLAVVSGLALLAALAIGGGLSGVKADAGQTGRFIAVAGAVCAAIAVYHVVRHPGAGGAGASLPGLDAAVTVRYGAYVAGLGGLLMLVGGLFAANGKAALATAPVVAPAAPVSTSPAPYAPPATPDPFAAPDLTPAPMPAADPFGSGAAPAPVMSAAMEPPPAPASMPAVDPFAAPPTPAAPAMTPPPPAPREPGSSIAPPGWAPPGA